MKTAIFSWFSYGLPLGERLRLIRGAGFDGVSLWWGREDGTPLSSPDLARRTGLAIDNAHAPWINAGDIWHCGVDGDEYESCLTRCLGECADTGVPALVVHTASLASPPPLTQTGIDRIRRLADCAEARGVDLAIENMNNIPHLAALFSAIPSDSLGFCYDSGHGNLLHAGTDLLSRFGDRLLAVHLADNRGVGDSHLLPFDGEIDWRRVMDGIGRSRPLRFLTAEVDFDRSHPDARRYGALPAEEFLRRARERLGRLMGEDGELASD